jgi:hypothetical protein
MTYTVQTTNQPVDDHGNAVDGPIEVEEHEFIDLMRQGLLVPGKGDLNDKGELKQQVAREATPEVRAVTGPAPTVNTGTES